MTTSRATTRADQERGPAPPPGGPAAPPPDAALGVWLSWMKNLTTAPAAAWGGGDAGRTPWLVAPDAIAGDALRGGVDRLGRMLSSDPVLTSIDRAWNANPLREVIPVDWAEVARALRTVWLRQLADPARAVAAAAELNAKALSAAVDAWN